MNEPTSKSVFFCLSFLTVQPIPDTMGLDGTIFCLIDESNKRGGPGPSHEGVNMEVTDFDYDLPKELIAQTPIEPRELRVCLSWIKRQVHWNTVIFITFLNT